MPKKIRNERRPFDLKGKNCGTRKCIFDRKPEMTNKQAKNVDQKTILL